MQRSGTLSKEARASLVALVSLADEQNEQRSVDIASVCGGGACCALRRRT